MADFQTVLDNVAQVIGGSQPDATNRPRWFSGNEVGDATGLQPGGAYPTFKGCHSAPPEQISDYPCGVILPGPFEVRGPQQNDTYVTGVEYNIDDLRLMILINRVDSETDYSNLNPYRDLVPTAYAAKMTAFSTANIVQAMVSGGKPITTVWADQMFSGIEFKLRVIRLIPRAYAL